METAIFETGARWVLRIRSGKARAAGGNGVCSIVGMAPINSFRDLIVWQQSMDLAVRVYSAVRRFPREEQHVLGHELRKSAVSIPSNISGGFCRGSTAFYIQHLKTAAGSNAELETQVEIGKRTSLIPEEEASFLTSSTQEIGRMLTGLINSLERGR